MSDLGAKINPLRPEAILDHPGRTIRNTPCTTYADVMEVPATALQPPTGFRPDDPYEARVKMWSARMCASPLTHTTTAS